MIHAEEVGKAGEHVRLARWRASGSRESCACGGNGPISAEVVPGICSISC